MKEDKEVIEEFNELINMTASELEKWLKSDDSRSAGWPKEDGGGESVGHDSGRQIVEILNSNPTKDPEKYTDDQVQHMRKVVSYCKRHLAQEEKIDNEKSVEELKKTKSYASLKNWGHDILKKRGKTVEDDGAAEEAEEDGKQTGDKRKAADDQAGAKKKRETQKGESNGAEQEEEDEDDAEEELEEVDENVDDEVDEKQEKKTNGEQTNGNQSNGQHKTGSKETQNGDNQDNEAKDNAEADAEADGDEGGSKNGPQKGETVSWNWGQGHPEGKVLDVRPEETTIETKRGNEVTRKGTKEDPVVVLDAGESKAIKLNHELN